MAWRNVSGPVLGAMTLMLVPALIDCGSVGKLGNMAGLPTPGECPSDPSAIMSATWGLDAQLEGKVKGGLAAAANLQKLAVDVEGEVATACGNLAKDLGASDADIAPKEEGPGKKAEAACNAAVKVLGELKAKASGKLAVKFEPPKCSASIDAYADCAAKCDVNVKPGSAEVKCEGGEISGKCGGKCEGKCTMEAGAQCEGTCGGSCEGTCDASFNGTCEGKCNGKCDGKDSKGAACKGTCDGKCEGKGKGTCSGGCKGTCSATCEAKASGECKGSCSGSCDVKMEAPKCSGEIKPPEMSGECKANCDAEVSGKLECSPATVSVNIEGAADVEAAGKLKAAISKNLPALLKVTIGMKAKIEGAVASVGAAIEGLEAVVKGGAQAAVKVGGCVAAALKAQVDASVSINVSVKASASASGSAGAG